MFIRERTLLAQRFDERTGRLEGDPSPIADNVDYFSPIGLAGVSVSWNVAGWQTTRRRPPRSANERRRRARVRFDARHRHTGHVPMTGGGTPSAFLKTEFNESMPQFSPDGRWLAYVSDEAGLPNLYVRPFPGPGEAQRISSGGGTQPRWRRDGKELFYVAGQRLMAVPAMVTPTFEAGAAQQLFDRRLRIIDYDVAADGQSLLINSEVSGPETKPINIVVNWMAVLKK